MVGKTLAITIPIEPVPSMRPTARAMKLLFVNDLKLTPTQLQLKRRIRRFQDYKQAVAIYARSKRFHLPQCDWHMIFYIETKDKERWGKPHLMKPDRDNLEKCVQDALVKSDSGIWDGRTTKYWCEPKKGRTEIWID
ncbi:MAG: RusA family crossover junction endodeoxyribonuclease [Chryseolinea sp.]